MSAAPTSPNARRLADKPDEARPTYTQRVVRDTLARWGAKIGLFWVLIVAFFAVFAPFIASTHPILMKTADGWSSPMLQHLVPGDVVLLVAALTIGVLWRIKSLTFRARVLIFLGVLLVTLVVSIATIKQPPSILYEQYREMEQAGETEYVLRTIIPYSPKDYLRDRGDTAVMAPSAEHWFGTEKTGADALSRMLHACRIALSIGFIATSIAVTLGIIIGGLMGYFSGIVDLIGMRLVEIMEAIPTLFLLLIFVAFFPGETPEVLPGFHVNRIYFIMVIIGLTSWSSYARFIRAEFLKLRQQDFVHAAKACGLPLWSILFRHMLPNGVAPVLVGASFGVASAILAEATLSFLGLGLVDEPSWGAMLDQALGGTGAFSWWLAIYPGGAIFLTVFAYNLIGESLRDAIDPHMKKSAHL